MSEKKNKPHLRLRLCVLFILRLALLIGPLCAVLIANRERYFTTATEVVQIAFGGMVCIVFVVLLLLGILKPPGKLFGFGFVFVMSWLLGSLLVDLFLLSGIAFFSVLIDVCVMEPLCRSTKGRIGRGKAAKTTATEVEEVLQKYVGRV